MFDPPHAKREPIPDFSRKPDETVGKSPADDTGIPTLADLQKTIADMKDGMRAMAEQVVGLTARVDGMEARLPPDGPAWRPMFTPGKIIHAPSLSRVDSADGVMAADLGEPRASVYMVKVCQENGEVFIGWDEVDRIARDDKAVPMMKFLATALIAVRDGTWKPAP